MKATTYAIAVLAMLPHPLNAQDAAKTMRVSHADLDLSTKAGVKLFDRRIAAAAKAVCPDTSGVLEFARLAIARRCAAQAEKGAKAQRDRIVSDYSGPELAYSSR
jgi:UrcA family protein